NVRRGDIGVIRAATNLLTDGTIFSASDPWTVSAGSLRSMEAASIGILESPGGTRRLAFGTGPDFLVRGGNVGLLRAYGTDPNESILMVNENLTVSGLIGGNDVVSPFVDITRIS